MQRLISQIGRSQRLAVVNLLKRNPDGLTVRDLADRLDMSYMGVKQHCVDLERDGYLDTFRRHRGVGRPELLYRLTNKAQDLFPQADNALAVSLLESSRRLYGAQAAGKILFLHFQEEARKYKDRLRGASLAERAKWLARLRDRDGYMADFFPEPTLRIVERHHPARGVFAAFPEAAAMERDMYQKILDAPVRREESPGGPGYECTFFIG